MGDQFSGTFLNANKTWEEEDNKTPAIMNIVAGNQMGEVLHKCSMTTATRFMKKNLRENMMMNPYWKP